MSKVKLRYGNGGENDGMTGMMKARMAYANEFKNPSAMRMVSPNPKTGVNPQGEGTHYMTSMDNYAVPLLQDKGGKNLVYNENPEPSSEDMRFDRPEDAEYFAEHYKDIAPMMYNKNFNQGGNTMNFKSNANYKKWLAYGHASGEFAKTPGNQSVSINGKSKEVNHNMNRGGNLFSMGGKNYVLGGEVDAFGNLIGELPKPAEMNLAGTDVSGLEMAKPLPMDIQGTDVQGIQGINGINGNQQNYMSQPSSRQSTQNSGTNTQGELENAGMVPKTPDDMANESQNIGKNALNTGMKTFKATGNPGAAVAAAGVGFLYNKVQQGMNNRKDIRNEDMASAEFQKNQQMNSTYSDPNSVYYNAAEGAAISGDDKVKKPQVKLVKTANFGTASQETKNAFNTIKAADIKAGYKSPVDSVATKKPGMAMGGNTMNPGGNSIEGEYRQPMMSTMDKVKSDATSLFKMMSDMIIPSPTPLTPMMSGKTNISPELPKPSGEMRNPKNKVKLTSGAKAGVKAIA